MLSGLHSSAGYPPSCPADISQTKSGDISSMAVMNALYADIHMAVSFCRSQRVPGCRTFVGSDRRCSLIDQYHYSISCSSSHGSAHLFVCCPSVCLCFETTFELSVLQNYPSFWSRENRTERVGEKYGQNTEFC
jgi:hypothetical protein